MFFSSSQIRYSKTHLSYSYEV